jgi:hypothetical protein
VNLGRFRRGYGGDVRLPAMRNSHFTLAVSENVASYPDLRRGLRRHLREVGDLVEMGRSEAARAALRDAIAISAEVNLTQPQAP